MYRYVFVSEEDRSLQRILWRFDKDSQIDVYELNTVTYGTAAASYLAIRCLFQLAHENRDKYPKIAKMIETDFYVDDLLTGCDTVEDLKQMSKLIHEILNQGCFKLRKFYSNNSEVLDWIVDNDGLSKIVNSNESDTAKTLGLMWCPSSDKLIYSVKPFPENSQVTRREILSGSSKNFDPLGLISPCIIQVKILLQGLWLEKVSWDDPLPSHIVSKWNEFKTDILSLNELSIDRHAFCKNMKSFELHIFSDSSEKAYGACIYVKTVDNFDNTSVNLLTAKARLAPLKSITIPRLELCGALLPARLTEKVSKALQVENIKRTFWTDSTIVLGWLKSAPNKLKTFVSNRVSEIQNLTTLDKWRHVPSEFNPADLVSRGIKPSVIQGTNLWWYGPEFLKLDESNWPENIGQYKKELPDVKKCVQNLLATNDERCILFDRFSDITKLTRIVAIMLRFASNAKIKKHEHHLRNYNPISVQESNSALEKLVGLAQMESFKAEIQQIKSKKLSPKHKLFSLNPFIDNSGYLRVGGRLANANFDFEKRLPLILSKDHSISKLSVRHYYIKLFHTGPEHILANLRDKYWIIAGRSLTRKIVHDCVKCRRFNPKVTSPLMGNLPQQRLQPTRPFDVIGIDYAGAFFIKTKLGRGAKIVKCYVFFQKRFIWKLLMIYQKILLCWLSVDLWQEGENLLVSFLITLPILWLLIVI
nr:unnamed protein product [Callosobruchus chinensis]